MMCLLLGILAGRGRKLGGPGRTVDLRPAHGVTGLTAEKGASSGCRPPF